jgi:hypothetical protein
LHLYANGPYAEPPTNVIHDNLRQRFDLSLIVCGEYRFQGVSGFE